MVENMEIDQENSDPKKSDLSDKLDKYKENLFNKLTDATCNLDKRYSQALFIQAMFKNDLDVLIKLFNFFIDNNQLQMSIDLIQNDIFKNFDLNTSKTFDEHINKFSLSIIKNLSNDHQKLSTITRRLIQNLDEKRDEFYFKIYKNLSSSQSQEVFIQKLLDKYRTNFSFLKNFIDVDKKQANISPAQQQADLKDFYLNLANNIENLYIMRDLLKIFKKHVQEYGLSLIDGFLNIEKHLYANLVQNSAQLKIDPCLINIEKRSLNLIRRICVIDLISEFVYLIDKLDNRHCYRWIEKSLEFFTKYSICSTHVVISNEINVKNIQLEYSSIKLLHESEILLNETTDETNQEGKERIINLIKEKLNDFIDYKYERLNETGIDSLPYYNVYKLLDEITLKLDWPTIKQNNFISIEDKMSYLFNLKSKADKNVSMSSLNKQISFYSLAFFFNKLTEFQSMNKCLFNDMLIFLPLFKQECTNLIDHVKYDNKNDDLIENRSIIVSNLIYCLKIWQKFDSHKEYYTIVTKCLSNSKLDSLSCYKSFLADYYKTYQLVISVSVQKNFNWSNLTSLNLKQKIAIISYLFMNEKESFNNFFKELSQLIEELNKNEYNLKSNNFYTSLLLSKNHMDLFELNKMNLLKYFSKLITEKLQQLIEQKKNSIINLINQNDLFILNILVLIQTSRNESGSDLYDVIFQLLKSKTSFEYLSFFDYIYDVEILQDFFFILNTSSKTDQTIRFNLYPKQVEDDCIKEKFLIQLNKNYSNENKYEIFEQYLIKNFNSFTQMFDQLLKC